MSEETARKTLANCSLTEFTRQAMKVRGLVSDYYEKIDFPKIIEKYKGVDDKENKDVYRNILTDVLNKAMYEYPEEYVSVIAAEGFMTFEEAEQLSPSDALNIFLECAMSQRVLDFFINVEIMAQSGTDSILPVLIFLKRAFSETSTSESESQSNTTDTSESAAVGDTLESA
jgi:hypothetical protein